MKLKARFTFFVFIAGLCFIGLPSCNTARTEGSHSELPSLAENSEKVSHKPRLLILTDIGGDPDDQQSLVRLLVYANEFDIEGIVTERWKKHSATDQIALVGSILEAYGTVRDNLVKHAAGYPAAEYLKSIVKQGAVDVVGRTTDDWMKYIGEGKDTDGSRHIISVLENADARPVHIAIWGGAADLAQALYWLRENRTPGQLAAIISKIRVHTIDHQDSTGFWIEENFPGLFLIYDFSPSGNRFISVYRGMYMGGDEALTSLSWIDTHIRNDHGPLGAVYPAKTSTQANPHGALKEGDTPSWFYFYENGLNDPAHPEYGGWGGRFEKAIKYYNDAEDNVAGITSARATVWRWRPHFQNDFQTRMDWCVKSFEEANHNPVASFDGDTSKDIIQLTGTPGAEVPLTARGSSDPDGDVLSFQWSIYPEAGTYKKQVDIADADAMEAHVKIPNDTEKDQKIHVILEVTDDGVPVLYGYRRIIISIQ